jgi:hypothetical protein
MKDEPSAELRRDRRAALRTYSTSLMSNTKWQFVLEALDDESLGIKQLIVQFVDVEAPKAMAVPHFYSWDPSPSAFADSFQFGPFPLVSIEWIEIPAVAIFPRQNNVPAEHYAQDIAAVRSALLALGRKLPLEDTSTGLRIVGHVR